MFKNKIIVAAAIITVLIFGGQLANVSAKTKKEAKFKVRIENISSSEGLTATDGSKYPFALSPGLFVVSESKAIFFRSGNKAGKALEAQAEDGNPEILFKKLQTKVGSVNLGIFNTPVGAQMPAPILPGGAFEFTFNATEGMKLNLIALYGQSNDLFYAPEQALDLFDRDGKALSGDITEKLMLWDAGTEINQAPGIGADQAPRQKEKNSGAAENAAIGMVKDGFTYPKTKDVLRVTITQE